MMCDGLLLAVEALLCGTVSSTRHRLRYEIQPITHSPAYRVDQSTRMRRIKKSLDGHLSPESSPINKTSIGPPRQ
jgi:hypothetical protein